MDITQWSPASSCSHKYLGMDESRARVISFGKSVNGLGEFTRRLHVYRKEIYTTTQPRP